MAIGRKSDSQLCKSPISHPAPIRNCHVGNVFFEPTFGPLVRLRTLCFYPHSGVRRDSIHAAPNQQPSTDAHIAKCLR